MEDYWFYIARINADIRPFRAICRAWRDRTDRYVGDTIKYSSDTSRKNNKGDTEQEIRPYHRWPFDVHTVPLNLLLYYGDARLRWELCDVKWRLKNYAIHYLYKYIQWPILAISQKLSYKIVRKYYRYLDESMFLLAPDVDERIYDLDGFKCLRAMRKKVSSRRDMRRYYHVMDQSLLDEIIPLLDVSAMCTTQKLTEEMMREYSGALDWIAISRNQPMSEDFIDEFANHIDWNHLVTCRWISPELMHRHRDKISWHIYRVLSISNSQLEI